jgi:hypothetical protein
MAVSLTVVDRGKVNGRSRTLYSERSFPNHYRPIHKRIYYTRSEVSSRVNHAVSGRKGLCIQRDLRCGDLGCRRMLKVKCN